MKGTSTKVKADGRSTVKGHGDGTMNEYKDKVRTRCQVNESGLEKAKVMIRLTQGRDDVSDDEEGQEGRQVS